MVLLYTDGILERPGRTPMQGTVELAQAAADIAANRALRDDASGQLLDGQQRRVLGAAGVVEAAQDLLGLGGAQLQRSRVLDHLVGLLGDQVPI